MAASLTALGRSLFVRDFEAIVGGNPFNVILLCDAGARNDDRTTRVGRFIRKAGKPGLTGLASAARRRRGRSRQPAPGRSRVSRELIAGRHVKFVILTLRVVLHRNAF